ncbi:hypothetical protein DEO72_LG9g1770 [Vigna unguiculata]|uniref:Uncharacterized protein n=1 Tax=Vigna unguiculata TaxID=3917 RepID=A0A4D6MZ64_VIGUN|nr:hypothetical protein DEO72_LG9g1770 [Vigna unguiculata]
MLSTIAMKCSISGVVYFLRTLGGSRPEGDAEGRLLCEGYYLVIIRMEENLVVVSWASPRPRVFGLECDTSPLVLRSEVTCRLDARRVFQSGLSGWALGLVAVEQSLWSLLRFPVAVFVLGLLKGMSTSSSGSNAGHSGASFVGLSGWSLYYDDEGIPKFPFYWIEAPTRLDAVSKDMLDGDSMRVVDVLERMPIKIPGKWVVCCYLTDSPAQDLCSVMAHHAKKVGDEVDLFVKIRDKMGSVTKAQGQSQAPNLRLCALAKTGDVGSSGSSNPDLSGFEKSRIQMRKGVEIKLSDAEVGVVEAADSGLVMRALNEYLVRGVVLGRRAWAEDKKKLEVEVRRLKQSVVGAKKKLKAKQVEMDEVLAAKEAAAEEAASEIYGLQQAIYSEHVNDFQKALRQVDFLYKEVSVTDRQINVNLDVYDNRMLDIAEIRRLKVVVEADALGEEATLATTPLENAEIGINEEDAEDAEEEDAEEAD